MTHLDHTDGIEDPFTGPPAASARPSRSSTSSRARGQQSMSALSQTLSSRLNSAKTQRGSAQDQKVASGSSHLPGRPAAITAAQQSGIPLSSNLNTTSGARPTAPHRSFSTTLMPSSLTSINKFQVTPRRSISGLQMSSSVTTSNGRQVTPRRSPSGIPTSSSLTTDSGCQIAPQRSSSGPSKFSSHPAIRSNVRKSSIAAIQPSSDNATQPVVHQSMPTNQIASSPLSYATSQRGPGSPYPVSMLLRPQSPSPKAPVATVNQLPPLRPVPVPYLNTFTVFPQLPMELQQEIWSVAIAVQYYMEKRFLRVAPDSKTLDRTDDEAEVAQLRIISDIHRRPRLVPSLLHVCQYTRKEALKGYELWGCADPITYKENSAKVYVKVDIDSFFFGDADLGDFWVFHTFLNESEPETANADDTARTNFIGQIGNIKHFAFDYELWVQMLEYEAMWLANLDSADQISVAIRNPNHEEFNKDYALNHMKTIVSHTYRSEAAQIIMHMTLTSLAAARQELLRMNWPESGNLDLNVRTLSMGNTIGNTPEDESYLEDVLIEGNRFGVVSDQYLETRLELIHSRAPQPPPAPVPTQNI